MMTDSHRVDLYCLPVGAGTGSRGAASRSTKLSSLPGSTASAATSTTQLATGDVWNSNSLIAWLLVHSGHDVDAIAPPPGGRAPGWTAGVVAARRAATAEARRDVLAAT